MNPAMCNTMIQSKRYLRIEANNKCIGNLARPPWIGYVLQVRPNPEPRLNLQPIINFGNALKGLDSNGAGRDSIGVPLILGQPGVGARIGNHERDNVLASTAKRALVVSASHQGIPVLGSAWISHRDHGT